MIEQGQKPVHDARAWLPEPLTEVSYDAIEYSADLFSYREASDINPKTLIMTVHEPHPSYRTVLERKELYQGDEIISPPRDGESVRQLVWLYLRHSAIHEYRCIVDASNKILAQKIVDDTWRDFDEAAAMHELREQERPLTDQDEFLRRVIVRIREQKGSADS